jgi:luciferase family oxidoreductase group 1
LSPTIALSILDQSPVGSGRTPADALAETQELARLADRLGYRRYWLAEHHNTEALAGPAPEVLIPLVAAATERIRVGSGGVMLSHYSPLKVAETFRVLHALFPGRIDLGIGRAPGSDRRTALALAQGQPQPIERFPQQLADLAAFLQDDLPVGHPFSGVRATPITAGAPELWLLGSSGESAAFAAALGCAFSFAHFINPQPGAAGAVLQGYRESFQPSPALSAPRASLAVRALCAETEAEARRLSASFALMRLRFEQGLWGPVPSLDEALAHPYMSPGAGPRGGHPRRCRRGGPGAGAGPPAGDGPRPWGRRAGGGHHLPRPGRPASLVRAAGAGVRAGSHLAGLSQPRRGPAGPT